MISKTKYKPRFFGFYLVSGIVKIVDGIITILVFLFGYTCDLYELFCVWNLKEDVKKRKKSLKHETPGNRPKPSPKPSRLLPRPPGTLW